MDLRFWKKSCSRAKLRDLHQSTFAAASYLRSHRSHRGSKIHICRLGVRTDVFCSVCGETARETLHIVSVGRLHPAKGQMILLEGIS